MKKDTLFLRNQLETRQREVAQEKEKTYRLQEELHQAHHENADMTPAEKYGVPEDVAKYLSDLRMKYCLAESWVSGDQDAQLCLKKAGYGNWGICEDYEDFVRKLVELEKPYLTAADAELKLKVQVYFAESDISEFTLYNQSHFRDSPTDDSRSDWRLWQRGNQVFREVLGSGRRERCDRI